VPGQQVLHGGNGDRADKHEERVDHGPEEGRARVSSYGEPDQGDQGGEEELGALKFHRVARGAHQRRPPQRRPPRRAAIRNCRDPPS
jgi:hypothetical protein